MQISLRLFLLVFASLLVGAMLSGQRSGPQKPVSRGQRAAKSQRVAPSAVAMTEQAADQDVEPQQLIPFLDPGNLPRLISDSNVVPAVHTEGAGKGRSSNQDAFPSDSRLGAEPADAEPATSPARERLPQGFSYLESADAVARLLSSARTVTKQVTLIGNQTVPEWVLRLQLRTKVKMPWISDGRFDPPTVNEDVYLLKQYYHNLGYFDVKVTPGIAISEDKSEAWVDFVINEGQRSSVREIEFAGNESLPESQLRELLQMQPGDPYDQRIVDADKQRIVAGYRKIGLKDVRVDPRTRSFEDPGCVDLIYEVFDFREQSGFSQTGEIRDSSRLAFSGVKSFDVAHIRQALEVDFDSIGAARPENPLEQYLETLRKTIADGYRHGGFPDAVVETAYRPGPNHIAVRVREGRRYRCGQVHVTGAQSIAADVIVRALTEESKPTRVRWKTGGPVPFDEDSALEMRKQLEMAFEDSGFYRPDFEIRIERLPDGDMADLTVSVFEDGPRAVFGKIEMSGLERNSTADVLKYLGVESGMPFDHRPTWALQRRLAESARFLSATVKEGVVSEEASARRQIRDLMIAVREYGEVPPLAAPLAPAEEALLKLGEWLQRWARGEIDEDIVVSAQTPQDPVDSRIAMKMIVGPRRGQTISLQALDPQGNSRFETVFVAYPDRLVLASPQRQAKLVLPNSAEHRLCLNIAGTAASAGSSDGRFRINLGAGWSSRAVPDPSPFEVKLDFSAVFMLSLAHEGKVQGTVHDGICKIANKDFELQVDTATGRPIEFKLLAGRDGAFFTVQARSHALSAEVARLEAPLAALVVNYDSTSPWKSWVDFAVDELLFAIEQTKYSGEVDSLRALHKLVHFWSPPALADLFETMALPLPESEDAFRLPTQRIGWSNGTALEGGSKARKLLLTRTILPVFRRLAPPQGDLWSVGRDLALRSGAGHATPADVLWSPELSVEMNPAALLLMQLLDEYVNGLAPTLVSRETLQCLELAAVREGCKPFLTGDSWSSRWLLSVATALRGLDEPELRCVLDLLTSDATFREALIECVAELRKSPDAPIQQVLPVAIDRFWAGVLQSGPPYTSGAPQGQLLPAAYYLKDDLQYFPPGPEFKLTKQAQATKEFKRHEQSKQPAKD